ncbi:MAG TPA: 50S ribosomal protein L18 [Anaerolineae bacterium]|nr:50S ribosomal protein L18 [Anaerolineae bacterium]
MAQSRNQARQHRHHRVRGKVNGTSERPRLNVFRSLVNIYAQIIDDTKGHTLVSASTIDHEIAGQADGKNGVDRAKLVGKVLAERAKAAGIKQVVFDRGGYKYQGQIKALADASRENGLEF